MRLLGVWRGPTMAFYFTTRKRLKKKNTYQCHDTYMVAYIMKYIPTFIYINAYLYIMGIL